MEHRQLTGRRTGRRRLAALAAGALGVGALVVGTGDSASAQIDQSIPFTTIMDIQGRGHVSPRVGEMVRFDGVITAVAFNGFYVQDNDGDGDNRTSDGIFVSTFRSSFDLDDLKPLRKVRITGEVSEFIPGGFGTGNLSTTNIIGADVLQFRKNGRFVREWVFPEKIGGPNGRTAPKVDVISDDELPVDLRNEPGDPFDPFADGIDFYESIEGMLVRLNDPQIVGATRRFNPFSAEAFAVLDGGDAVEPADALTSRGGIALQPDVDNTGDQNPERVQIQFDGTIYPDDVPLLNVGDQLRDVTGVVGYSFGNFEVNATQAIRVRRDGGLEPEVTELAPDGDEFTLGSYNVLNLDPGDGARFDIVGGHIADNMAGPDVVALQEIQDNNGTVDDDVVDADQTFDLLVAAIEAAGGPSYEWVDVVPPVPNEFGGQPGGNIRNGFLWNPDRVSLTDVESLDIDAFPTGSRDPLVGTFDFQGNEIVVANNHFTSRFGSTPVFGGVQPFVQAGEAERGAQAQAMNDLVDGLLAENPEALVAVAGDLNTFEFTDELAEVLPGPEPVLTNLLTERPSDDDSSYTFIFEGNSQALDHIFVTDGLLAADAEFDVVHTNVDFARDLGDATTGSDHEPMVARFTLPEVEVFTLQVLHASDLEGGVDALDRAPNFAAIVDGLEESNVADGSITVSAGDNYIPGPFFSAAGDRAVFRDGGVFNDVYNELFGTTEYAGLREGGGRVDVSIMNVIGFDASAVGNHEFDLGSDAFESIIEEDFRGDGLGDDRWVGAQFPYLSANFDFSADGDLGNLFTSDLLPNTAFATGPDQSAAGAADTPKIAPATLVDAGGETIGVVGATTPLLQTISSPGLTTAIGPTTNDMPALAAVLQPSIDAILAADVDKVVLVSHLQQFALEQELIGLLSGVDIVIAGGSDTLLADDDDVLRDGDVAALPYPFVGTNADGDPAVVVSTDGEYSYVGRLVVTFEDGVIDDDAIDPVVNGPIASTDENVSSIAAELGTGLFDEGTKGSLVQQLVDAARG
ncbi:MAG: endonuclease/exonuclease/phosphatase family protein, partial [Actinomycetota bacterium]